MRRATEQSDAAVEALELNALHGALIVINVRLAADRNCSTDSGVPPPRLKMTS